MKKVLIGMSGGVDSSVAAYLLKQKGYEVIGVTMKMWDGRTDSSIDESNSLLDDAKRVADQLGVKHIEIDMTEAFHRNVQCNFINEYLQGRTPNPCVQCNEKIKWAKLLEEAKLLSADYIATGHYARIITLLNGRVAVSSAFSMQKDQTYALYRLTQDQLRHTLMPIGELEKEEVRRIAEEIGLSVAQKADSMEICFIPDNDYASYISRNTKDELPGPGNFVDKNGAVLGRHKGIIHYTVGQRKGLNLSMGHPVFVTGIRPETNEVVIGENEDVFTNTLKCNQLSFMGMEPSFSEQSALVKIRYAHKGSIAKLIRTGEDEITCQFEEPVRAVTPGQSAVFYQDGYVLGGGIIFG